MPMDLTMISEYIRNGQYSITTHGYEELDNDSITIVELEIAIGEDAPEIIEDYPDDPRGASCLILGWPEPNIPVHVCLGVSQNEPEVITAYRPSPNKFWPPEYRKRR